MTWEYIAGFIDGEGSIIKKKRVYNLYISQTNFEVLEEIRLFTGVGKIYEVSQRRPNWKQAWVYNAAGGYGTYYILENVIDHLILKQEWAFHVMERLKNRLGDLEKQKKIKQERRKKALELREKGYTYREIGKMINTDYGYVRRLVLFKI